MLRCEKRAGKSPAPCCCSVFGCQGALATRIVSGVDGVNDLPVGSEEVEFADQALRQIPQCVMEILEPALGVFHEYKASKCLIDEGWGAVTAPVRAPRNFSLFLLSAPIILQLFIRKFCRKAPLLAVRPEESICRLKEASFTVWWVFYTPLWRMPFSGAVRLCRGHRISHHCSRYRNHQQAGSCRFHAAWGNSSSQVSCSLQSEALSSDAGHGFLPCFDLCAVRSVRKCNFFAVLLVDHIPKNINRRLKRLSPEKFLNQPHNKPLSTPI